jgi:hypothetical protein
MYVKGGIDSDRLYKFIETYITNKYKNKLLILDYEREIEYKKKSKTKKNI